MALVRLARGLDRNEARQRLFQIEAERQELLRDFPDLAFGSSVRRGRSTVGRVTSWRRRGCAQTDETNRLSARAGKSN